MAALLLFGVFASAYLGFAFLALSQTHHWRQVTGDAQPVVPSRVIVQRCMGAAMLGLSLALALWRDGPAFGAILWVVTLTAAASVLCFALTLAPRTLRWVGFIVQMLRKRQTL